MYSLLGEEIVENFIEIPKLSSKCNSNNNNFNTRDETKPNGLVKTTYSSLNTPVETKSFNFPARKSSRALSRAKQIEEKYGEYSIFDSVEHGMCDILFGISNFHYEPIDRQTRAVTELIQKELDYKNSLEQFIRVLVLERVSNEILSSLRSIYELTKCFIEDLKEANYNLIKIARVYEVNISLFKKYLEYILLIKRQGLKQTSSSKALENITVTSRILFHVSFLKVLRDTFYEKEEYVEALNRVINTFDKLIEECELQFDISYDIEEKFSFSSRGRLLLRDEFRVDKKKSVVFMFERLLLFTSTSKEGSLTFKHFCLTSNIVDVEISKSKKLILNVKDENGSVKKIKLKSQFPNICLDWQKIINQMINSKLF